MAAWGSAPRVRAVVSVRRRLNIHIQTMAIFTRHLAARAVAVVFAAWQALACSGAAWEARVVDAATGKPLPSASVKTAAGRKTITNSEGWFEVECAPAESVTVSFVGYTSEGKYRTYHQYPKSFHIIGKYMFSCS